MTEDAQFREVRSYSSGKSGDKQPSVYMRLLPHISAKRSLRRSSPEFQALYRLSSDVAKFNEWRKKKQTSILDLSGIRFKELNLTDIDFYALKLKNSTFENVNLTGANFWGANLNGAQFINCTMNACDFTQARLANADFSGNNLNDTVFFETIRDNWVITNVRCERSWITKSPRASPNEPDCFKPGEFEVCYGGKRFKILFPGGFKPVDLLALPFYVKKFLETEKGESVLFTGLSTIGEAGLEFRIERNEKSQLTVARLTESLSAIIERTRKETGAFYREIIDQKDSMISAQAQLLNRMMTELGPRQTIINNIATDAFTMKQGDEYNVHQSQNQSATAAVGPGASLKVGKLKTVKSTADFAKLADELGQLIAVLKSHPDSVERAISIENLETAQKAIKEGRSEEAGGSLRKVGKWVISIGERIGVTLAAATLKDALGA